MIKYDKVVQKLFDGIMVKMASLFNEITNTHYINRQTSLCEIEHHLPLKGIYRQLHQNIISLF